MKDFFMRFLLIVCSIKVFVKEFLTGFCFKNLLRVKRGEVCWLIQYFISRTKVFCLFTTPSCTAMAPAFEVKPGPATAEVHSDATRSNTASTSRFVVYEILLNKLEIFKSSIPILTCIQLPIPLRKTF